MLSLHTDTPFITTKTLVSMLSQAQGYTKGLPYDLHSLFETQRTNWLAIAEAQETLIANMQNISRQQSRIMSIIWKNHTAFLSLMIDEGTPEEKLVRHAEISKKQYKDIVHEVRHMQDSISQTLRNAADILHHRTISTLSEGQRQAGKALMIPANADDITQKKIAA